MIQTIQLRHGDCIEVLQGLADGSIGALVSDPYSLKCQDCSNGPFGIGQEVHLPDLDEKVPLNSKAVSVFGKK